MKPWQLGLAALAGAALLFGAASASAAAPSPSAGGEITPDEREAFRRRAREVSEEIEAAYGIAGLADYLDAVAQWESRWNPGATGDGGRSLGLYQMQAGTAFRQSNGLTAYRPQADPILYDPVLSTILAADYAVNRVKRSRAVGGPGDWFAVRRGWRKPASTADVAGTKYPDVWNRVLDHFTQSLKAVGLPASFMSRAPDVSGYPGVQQVLDDLNVTLSNATSA